MERCPTVCGHPIPDTPEPPPLPHLPYISCLQISSPLRLFFLGWWSTIFWSAGSSLYKVALSQLPCLLMGCPLSGSERSSHGSVSTVLFLVSVYWYLEAWVFIPLWFRGRHEENVEKFCRTCTIRKIVVKK